MMEEVDEKNPKGLSSAEAAVRLRKYGPNELPSKKAATLFHVAAQAVREPMFFLLLSCGLLYMVLGNYREGIVMLCSILVIIAITFYQHTKTEKALLSLKALSVPQVWVRRDGTDISVPGRELVPGDIVLLSEGDRIPADALLIGDSLLSVDESLLTGEAVPVTKGGNTPDGGLLLSGTLIVKGRGAARVTATGTNTKFGGIGVSLQQIHEGQTLLQIEMKRLIKTLFRIGLALCVTIVLAFYWSTGDFLAALLNGLAAAMAIVPEEFYVVLTVFLALGAWRLTRMNVLVRKPSAVEALGAIDVLCTDKTGTITQNAMEIAHVYAYGQDAKSQSGHTLPERDIIAAACLACPGESRDPMEKAIGRYAAAIDAEPSGYEILREYPLEAGCFAMTNVVRRTLEIKACCKGAPESVVKLCRLEGERAQIVLEEALRMASAGLRVLAVAEARATEHFPETQSGFAYDFLGLLGFEDPVRPEVQASVSECRQAGIRVIMITGDFPETARSIAAAIGMERHNVMTGAQIEQMSDPQLQAAMPTTDIFARVVPEQKLRIVRALKANRAVVAMTGDGINDAPALKAADIGIAMGKRGTDVAREAASMVLTDDNFASIVKAIRSGRKIYDNLQKAMDYILAIHIPIIILALLPAIFTGIPPLLLPLHIIFLELIIDPVSSVVFESEREERNSMSRPPRDPRQPFFGRKRIRKSLFKGLLLTAMVLAVNWLSMRAGMPVAQSRTLAFIALVSGNILMTLSSLSTTRSIIGVLRENNIAVATVLLAAAFLLVLVMAVPALRDLFGLAIPGFENVLLSLAGPIAFVTVLEGVKRFGKPQ